MASSLRRSRWLPGLRALLRLGRRLDAIVVQLTRIADAAEGKTPPQVLPPDDFGLPTADPPLTNFRDVDLVDRALRAQLGREPTPEEIIAVLDDAAPDDWPKLARLVRDRPNHVR